MTKSPYSNRWLLATLALLLSACTRQVTQPPTPTHPIANLALEQWQLSGKLGIRGEDISESAYLNWQQCGDEFSIRLSGPLGNSAAHLSGNSDQVLLETGEGSYRAPSAEQLVYQQLGWQLPVSQLTYWVRGVPAPNIAVVENSQGFIQTNWQLRYPKSRQVGEYLLPTKVIAENPQLKTTLIIKSWQLDAPCEQ